MINEALLIKSLAYLMKNVVILKKVSLEQKISLLFCFHETAEICTKYDLEFPCVQYRI